MQKILDKVLDKYINLYYSEKNEGDAKEIIEAAKEEIKRRIYSDIKEEIKEEALRDADEIIKKRAELHRLKELRNLSIEGIFIAFFVGLLVNQVTDIIGYYKGSVNLDDLLPTFILVLIFGALGAGIFIFAFMSTFLDLWKREQG